MRTLATLLLAGVATWSVAQQFSVEERDTALAFWAAPNRYAVSVPDDVAKAGIWQVRLTVAGSTWLWNYQKGKKIPPTQNPVPETDEQKQFEAWIQAKVARDRWEALQRAQSLNERVLGKRVPETDKDTPTTEPPLPGPMPANLLAQCGDCPVLAEAVVPTQHTITFDDATIVYKDNPRLWNPRYAFYRSEKGVMSGGVPAKSIPKDKVEQLCAMAGINGSEAKVMKSVSMLEGGFDSVNTYDTGFVSVGFIQFASLSVGANSLGALLKLYKEQFPEDYQHDFKAYGIDVTPDGVLDVLDLSTGSERIGPDANKQIIEDKRLIAVFQRAGLKSDKFNAMQLKAAHDIYMPANDAVTIQFGTKTVTGTVSDFIKTEAGLAVLMDRKVNTGKLDPLVLMITDLAAELNIEKLSDLAPYERDIVAAVKYRKDYLSDPELSQPAVAPSTRWSSQISRGSQGRNGRGGTKSK